jgi:hypothetical protein
MLKNISYQIIFCLMILGAQSLQAQDTVQYIGNTLSNIDYHHGQLTPVVGVHNRQVFHADRSNTENNWTYNHAPMLVYWNNQFYLEYLSNPVGEHTGAGRTLLLQSKDGIQWSKPIVIFPSYKIPDGFVKAGKTDTAKNTDAVMHQRIGFYVASNHVLLAQGFYGIVLGKKDDPNDGNGVGRVVREIRTDGSFGDIYFIHYNHNFNASNTNYPFYTTSKNKAFVAACTELLSKPLMMQQWVEEADRNDPIIPLKKDFKAFSFYHLNDGRTVGLWKYALTSISKDNGVTWLYNPLRAPGFVNANAKIWGQKTTDGKYATVYNPSEFRWPLALSTSDDGLHYKDLFLVNGEISTLRYGGAYKSYGPQYVRGIQEGEGVPPDQNMWVTYSMNKEDIWVSKIPIPVQSTVSNNVNDNFNTKNADSIFNQWNIFSPLLAPVSIERNNDQKTYLTLKDEDPFDFAKAERVFPAATKMSIDFSVIANQQQFGLLEIELVDNKGLPCIRLSFDSTGYIITKAGYRNKNLVKYTTGENMHIQLDLDVKTRFYNVTINGKNTGPNLIFAPVQQVSRITFRTGSVRRFPNADTPTDQDYDLPNPTSHDPQAIFYISGLKTNKIN